MCRKAALGIAAAALLLTVGCASQRAHVADSVGNSAADRSARLEAGLRSAVIDSEARVTRVADGILVMMPWPALFQPNSYDYSLAGVALLDRLGQVLAPGEEPIILSGLSDGTGNSVINRPQSLNRAAAVANRLAARGVSPRRLMTVGLGSARPLASNDSAEGRQRNRRIELLVRVRS